MSKQILKNISIIFIVLMIFGCGLNEPQFANVSIINKSQNRIATGSVMVCKQILHFQNINPGDITQLQYEIIADSDYKVKILFDTGKSLEGTFGYITTGLIINDEIMINDKSIVLKPSQEVKR